MSDDVLPFYCRGCGRYLGVVRRVNYAFYCDEMCAADFPAAKEEARVALMAALSDLPSWQNYTEIGRVFGFSRQYVQKMLKERDVRNL